MLVYEGLSKRFLLFVFLNISKFICHLLTCSTRMTLARVGILFLHYVRYRLECYTQTADQGIMKKYFLIIRVK